MSPEERRMRDRKQLELGLRECFAGQEKELFEELYPGCYETGLPPLHIINLVLHGGRLPVLENEKGRSRILGISKQAKYWS